MRSFHRRLRALCRLARWCYYGFGWKSPLVQRDWETVTTGRWKPPQETKRADG